MAHKVSIDLIDDLDGSDAEESIEFALDGITYTIDLSEDNAIELRDALAHYVSHSTRTGGRKKPATPRKTNNHVIQQDPATANNRERSQAIRAWAREQGYEISERGRIPRDVLDAYDTSR